MIYSPHVYENPLNNMLNVIFSKFIKNAIDNEKQYLAHIFQWKLKQTIYGILVSKLIMLLII